MDEPLPTSIILNSLKPQYALGGFHLPGLTMPIEPTERLMGSVEQMPDGHPKPEIEATMNHFLEGVCPSGTCPTNSSTWLSQVMFDCYYYKAEIVN